MQTEAQLFKTLADETRLKILWLLLEKNELCVSDIEGILLIPQSTVSRHLRHLLNAGLVTNRRERQSVYYRISVAPGSREGKQLQLLREMVAEGFATQALRRHLRRWFRHDIGSSEGE
jgi:ArsR family transcriptional regulator, arsenate/arsenite/antimonite-responsive transcriptional repressor